MSIAASSLLPPGNSDSGIWSILKTTTSWLRDGLRRLQSDSPEPLRLRKFVEDSDHTLDVELETELLFVRGGEMIDQDNFDG